MARTPQTLLSSIFTAILLTVTLVASCGAATPKFGKVTACKTVPWVEVIDVSSNNVHPLGWSALENSGVAGVYIKNSEGNWYTNPYLKTDISGATAAGMPYGEYYFANPSKVGPIASADYFVKHGGASGQLPPALDLEVEGSSPTKTVQWTIAWLERVRYLTNRTPIIYTGAYQPWSSTLALAGWTLWLPAYPNGYKPTPNVCALPLPTLPASWSHIGWTLWQYTSVGHPVGTRNNTDIEVALQSWFSKWTGSGVLPPTKGVTKVPVPIYTSGSYGAKVIAIQKILITHKLLPKGSADGVFGASTKTALEKWQVIIGVKGDGEWSAATQRASNFYLAHGYTLTKYEAIRALYALLSKIKALSL